LSAEAEKKVPEAEAPKVSCAASSSAEAGQRTREGEPRKRPERSAEKRTSVVLERAESGREEQAAMREQSQRSRSWEG
jgi:hypothetical protein